jgi:hypothetical protein
MEVWEYHEGETWKIGGYPITLAKARGGHFVAFVGSGTCETSADTERKAREYRLNLDNRCQKADDMGN